ncbi:hypothetical protein SUGI_0378710 [Cryptomeria japonica]|nr:hypothetical protein SUGI_0378710 [Cryptomeria japonica]
MAPLPVNGIALLFSAKFSLNFIYSFNNVEEASDVPNNDEVSFPIFKSRSLNAEAKNSHKNTIRKLRKPTEKLRAAKKRFASIILISLDAAPCSPVASIFLS